ncbi:MAG: symporter small accessory protein [Bacillota bacterium]
MFGLDSIMIALAYVLSAACTVFCLIYGIVKAVKR